MGGPRLGAVWTLCRFLICLRLTSETGPISLLMTTNAIPESETHLALLRRLFDLKTLLPLSGLSVHLLHVTTRERASPNAYLNLARLFAGSSTVMLVPGDLSVPPFVSLDGILSQKSQPTPLPWIVTPSSQGLATFSALSFGPPVILQQNHPVWCTDRVFYHNTRASDWQECLWQLWVESFGEFGKIHAPLEMPAKAADSDTNVSLQRKRYIQGLWCSWIL